ncbi:MAG: hypothetical protein LV480_14855 [Methylacidiphilales bacterium]|nr:hypothetical protein [Candidatus Methylacidiphilales bacterium]
MKPIFHHFLKDVRSMRWMLGLWLLIVCLQNLAGFLAVQPDYEVASNAEKFSAIWYLLDCVTWTTLIVVVVQSEPVTGDTSFWRTRPIPRLTYALSKSIFILGFAIAPMLAAKRFDFWLFEVNPHDADETIRNFFILQVLVALCVLWLATYTRTLLQFFGVIVVGVLLCLVIGLVRTMTILGLAPNDTDPSLLNTRAVVAFLIFLVGLTASLVVQYGFRRTRIAFVTGAGSILFSILALQWWPLVLPGTSVSVWPPGAVHLDYQIDAAKPIYWNEERLDRISYQIATASLTTPASTMEGIPVIRSVASTFQPKDGAAILLPSRFGASGVIDVNSLNWLDQVKKDNPDLAIVGPTPSVSPRGIFVLTPGLAEKVRGLTGTLDLKIGGNFIYLRKRAEMPLREAGLVRIPNGLIRVSVAQNQTHGIDLWVKEDGYMNNQLWTSLPTVYLLVDRKKRTGCFLAKTWNSQSFNLGATLGRVSSQETLRIFPDLQDSSLDDLVLYIYEETAGPTFDSEISVPNYTMHPGDNSVGGDYADVTIKKIETTANGGVTATLLVFSSTKKPIMVSAYGGKSWAGVSNINGREGDWITTGFAFNLNPEGSPATKNAIEAPWFKRLLIHEGEKRRLNDGDRLYFDDFWTSDGLRHYAYIGVQSPTGTMIQQYGHFDFPETPWVIDVSENKISLGHQTVSTTVVSNPSAPVSVNFLENIASSASPSNWKAHPGWFVYAQNSEYCWTFDGKEQLYLTEFTPGHNTMLDLGLPIPTKFGTVPIIPKEVFYRLPSPMQQELKQKFPTGR